MRVLFINSRQDAQLHPGGDTIQMSQTKSALTSLGLAIEVRSPYELENLPKCDLAHVFNIQEPESAWGAFQALQKKGIPTVLSPIYWDLYAYWFELAAKERPSWRWLVHLFGNRLVEQIYIRWQRMKAPANSQWQLQKELLSKAQRVLPNSRSEISLLRQSFDLNRSFEQKVDIVPNAIDTDLYECPPPPNDAFREKYGVRDFVLEVGRIYPVKNQLGLIEALFDLPIPLVFIGQVMEVFADYAEACKAIATRRGNVIFIDQLPYEELPGIYALAAVHALPSWRETPGLVSLEAAAAGSRVVTTSIGSARDYFGDQAWYCYPDNLDSIRDAVNAALNAAPSTALRRRVLTQYTWQHAAEATRSSYEKVLNQI